MSKKKSSDPTDDSESTKTTSTTTSRPTHPDDIRRRQAAAIEVLSMLLKEYDDTGYRRAFHQSFTNVPENAGYNDGLPAPQPDFIEGLKAGEFRPFPVADHIPGAAMYKDDPNSVTLPQIAGIWKGPDGSMEEAERQSAYVGAAMVYARNQALAYMGKSDPPGHTAILTFTTDGTTLTLYAHYATPSEEDKGRLEYHQYPIKAINVIESYQGYEEATRYLRNAQDYARERSYALKDQLKEYYKQQRQGGLHPSAEHEVPLLPIPDTESTMRAQEEP
ncbi:hypothetical protein B0T16DRAFT_407394 [Cercophora newfieldiana]|uniref:DUF7924 domain-containing protein n=1 Tax=Cercophora newfieldiana TaxID=92897 RepID=A0AA39YIR8_9PEZI|nr:hypothetical protein B0T16DRAFT_407394 [Cercophora newfieldiana]